MKTNRFISYIFMAALLCLAASCIDDSSLLDKEEVGDLTEKDVFGNPSYARYFVNNIYYNFPGSGYEVTSNWYGAYLDCATDNGEARHLSSSAQAMNNGNWNANSFPVRSPWSTDYAQIRACNKFLANFDNIPTLDGVASQADLDYLKAQVYFLRAAFYADLLKNFGGVPKIDEVLNPADTTIVPERMTYAQTVDYVCDQLDLAAAKLDAFASYASDASNYGRATKGAALALKAKVLLYAASPLFNRPSNYSQFDSSDANVALWRYPSYDKERWKKAADALKEVIDLGTYSLWTSKSGTKTAYETYFVTRYTPSETIFPVLAGPSINIYYNNLPFNFLLVNSLGSPMCYNLPTHNLVASYEMANGMLPEQEGSGYRPLHPFSGRDPRLNATVWHDESEFCGIKFDTWRRDVTSAKDDGKDYITGYSRTGYFLRKYMDVNLDPRNSGVTLPNCYPVIRYADILLMYAEALNEYEGPSNAGVAASIDAVRSRAEMPSLAATFTARGWAMDQDKVREFIAAERRVEFAFEEYRFWDVRRLMIAPQTQVSISELDIVLKDDDKTKTYTVKQTEKRAWNDRMYYMPIPQVEINRNPNTLVQNWNWAPKNVD